MIQIEGLTPLQMEILERIWSMDSQEQVMAWFETLPRSLRQIAHAMLMMVVIEMIDEEPCEDLDLARAVIDRVRWGHA
jgi:hypothetical protein